MNLNTDMPSNLKINFYNMYLFRQFSPEFKLAWIEFIVNNPDKNIAEFSWNSIWRMGEEL